jgi:hypothetical protein
MLYDGVDHSWHTYNQYNFFIMNEETVIASKPQYCECVSAVPSFPVLVYFMYIDCPRLPRRYSVETTCPISRIVRTADFFNERWTRRLRRGRRSWFCTLTPEPKIVRDLVESDESESELESELESDDGSLLG